MIFFLYGPDTYRLQQKAKEIESQYLKVNQGVLNLEKFDAGDIAFENFWETLSQRSMFIQKKLFFVENIFTADKFADKFAKKIKDIVQSADITVILERKNPPAKHPLFKALLKQSQVQEFKKLDNVRLRGWIKKQLFHYGAIIDESALNCLLLFAGDDLWRLSNELKKLASYRKDIREENIKLLVKPKIETEIFQTIDALAERNNALSLRLLQKHLNKGENPFYVFSMFVYQFRNSMAVKSANGDPNRLRQLKLHPFVLKKTNAQASRFSLSELKNQYQKIFNMDLAMKTGKISTEDGLRMLIAEI